MIARGTFPVHEDSVIKASFTRKLCLQDSACSLPHKDPILARFFRAWLPMITLFKAITLFSKVPLRSPEKDNLAEVDHRSYELHELCG